MPTDTCRVALVRESRTAQTQVMEWAQRTRRTEIVVAWVVAIGVAAAGAYDFENGASPSGLVALSDGARFAVFFGGCVLAATLATVMLVVPLGAGRPWFRGAVLAASVVAAALADPTYGSLLLAVPLIDIRRREAEPSRTLWTLGIVGIVGWLLLSEDTPRVVAEVEALFGLAIAFFIIVMFGDALRQLDRGMITETELAQLTERNRLTSELHDSVGHHLLAASVQLKTAKALRGREPAGSSRAVDFASGAVAEAISETRLIVDATRHDRGFEMESAIRELTKRVVPATMTITLSMNGDHRRIDPLAQIALYRVVQEALSNVVRHAAATTARIATDVTSECVRLEIIDDGAGFSDPPGQARGGVENMRKRVENLGGTFAITSAPGCTSVLATVPA
jgi:signal transduction histidine kinase